MGKGDKQRPTDLKRFADNYTSIFGDVKPGNGNGKSGYVSSPDNIVNTNGDKIKLRSWQKNEIYRKARELRAEIKEQICTRNECNDPSDRNVQKMLHSEFKAKKAIQQYKQSMKAIGADPKDVDVERLRRR